MFKKIIAFLISFVFLFEQVGFAQVANVIDLSGSFSSVSSINKFRPLHLRSLVYDRIKDDFTLLLDKGDNKNIKPTQIKDSVRKLMEYFQIGVTLPDSSFWVNLRPDGKDNIIDPELEKTDLGKVLLQADLQLKKDMAMATSPKTREGKLYWNRLYEKAESLFGNQEVTIPTLTRPWIVPGEIIVKQSADSAYVYKATLKVMLEQDYLKNSATYGFDDPRLKELNEFSSNLIREIIIPPLTKKVNSSKVYADLRQVYYSLILAQWFKKNSGNIPVEYARRVDTKDLSGLTSRTAWSKDTYFNAYHQSFVSGEYNTQETVNSLNGITARKYFSGGVTPMPKAGDIMVVGQKNPAVPADVLVVDNKTSLPVNLKDIVKNHVEQDKNDGGLGNAAFTEANKKIVANNVSLLANYSGLIDRFRATKENNWMVIYGTCDKNGAIQIISPSERLYDSYAYEVKFYFQAGRVRLEPHYNAEIRNNRETIEKILGATFQALDQKYAQVQNHRDGGIFSASMSGVSESRSRALAAGLVFFGAGGVFYSLAMMFANPLLYLPAGVMFFAASFVAFRSIKVNKLDTRNRDGGKDRAKKISDFMNEVMNFEGTLDADLLQKMMAKHGLSDWSSADSIAARQVTYSRSISLSSNRPINFSRPLTWKRIFKNSAINTLANLPLLALAAAVVWGGWGIFAGLSLVSWGINVAGTTLGFAVGNFLLQTVKGFWTMTRFVPASTGAARGLYRMRPEIMKERSAKGKDGVFVDSLNGDDRKINRDGGTTDNLQKFDKLSQQLQEALKKEDGNKAGMIAQEFGALGDRRAVQVLKGLLKQPDMNDGWFMRNEANVALSKLEESARLDGGMSIEQKKALFFNLSILEKHLSVSAADEGGYSGMSWLEYFTNMQNKFEDSFNNRAEFDEFKAFVQGQVRKESRIRNVLLAGVLASILGVATPLVITSTLGFGLALLSGAILLPLFLIGIKHAKNSSDLLRAVDYSSQRDLHFGAAVRHTALADVSNDLNKPAPVIAGDGISNLDGGSNMKSIIRTAWWGVALPVALVSTCGLTAVFMSFWVPFAVSSGVAGLALGYMIGLPVLAVVFGGIGIGHLAGSYTEKILIQRAVDKIDIQNIKLKEFPGDQKRDGGSDIRVDKITKNNHRSLAHTIGSFIDVTDVVAVTSFFAIVVSPLLSIAGYTVILALSLFSKDIGAMFFQLPPLISVPGSIIIGAATILGLDKAAYTAAYLIDTRIEDFEGPVAEHKQDGGVFVSKRSRTDELSSAIKEINWMRSADRDFVGRRLDRVRTLLQDNKYTQDEIKAVLASINTKALDEWFFARKANTALMLGGFAVIGGLSLAGFLITGPVLLPMILGISASALLGITVAYNLYKLIASDIPVRDLTNEYYREAAKMLNAAVPVKKNALGIPNRDGGKDRAERLSDKGQDGVFVDSLNGDDEKINRDGGKDQAARIQNFLQDIKDYRGGEINKNWVREKLTKYGLLNAIGGADQAVKDAVEAEKGAITTIFGLFSWYSYSAKLRDVDMAIFSMNWDAIKGFKNEYYKHETWQQFAHEIRNRYDGGSAQPAAIDVNSKVERDGEALAIVSIGLSVAVVSWLTFTAFGYLPAVAVLSAGIALMIGTVRIAGDFIAGYLLPRPMHKDKLKELIGDLKKQGLEDDEIDRVLLEGKEVFNIERENIGRYGGTVSGQVLAREDIVKAIDEAVMNARVLKKDTFFLVIVGATCFVSAAVVFAGIPLLVNAGVYLAVGTFSWVAAGLFSYLAVKELRKIKGYKAELYISDNLNIGNANKEVSNRDGGTPINKDKTTQDKNIAVNWFGTDIQIPEGLLVDIAKAWVIASVLEDAKKIFQKAVQGIQDVRGGTVEEADRVFVEANTDDLLRTIAEGTAVKLAALSEKYGAETVVEAFGVLEFELPASSGRYACIQAALKDLRINSATQVADGGDLADIGYLYNGLKYPNSAVRGSAARELMIRKDTRSVGPLIEALKTETMPNNRYAITQALAAIGGSAVDPLRLVVMDPNVKMQSRQEAVRALADIAKQKNSVVKEGFEELYDSAARYSPVIKPLLDILTNDKISFEEQLEAARVLIAQQAGRKFIIENRKLLTDKIGVMMVLLNAPAQDGGSSIALEEFDALANSNDARLGELRTFIQEMMGNGSDPVALSANVLREGLKRANDIFQHYEEINPLYVSEQDWFYVSAAIELLQREKAGHARQDGGGMPTEQRFNAWDTEGAAKRKEIDAYSSAAKESGGSTSGEVNTGDNVFDGGTFVQKARLGLQLWRAGLNAEERDAINKLISNAKDDEGQVMIEMFSRMLVVLRQEGIGSLHTRAVISNLLNKPGLLSRSEKSYDLPEALKFAHNVEILIPSLKEIGLESKGDITRKRTIGIGRILDQLSANESRERAAEQLVTLADLLKDTGKAPIFTSKLFYDLAKDTLYYRIADNLANNADQERFVRITAFLGLGYKSDASVSRWDAMEAYPDPYEDVGTLIGFSKIPSGLRIADDFIVAAQSNGVERDFIISSLSCMQYWWWDSDTAYLIKGMANNNNVILKFAEFIPKRLDSAGIGTSLVEYLRGYADEALVKTAEKTSSNRHLADGGMGIYSTSGIRNNLEAIDSYDYGKARDLAMILAKRIGSGELSAYFAGRLTVIGDVSVDGPITIGYKETPSDTITILSVSSTEQRQKGVRVNNISPIQIKINKLNNDIVLMGIDKQVVVPSGLAVSKADGGEKTGVIEENRNVQLERISRLLYELNPAMLYMNAKFKGVRLEENMGSPVEIVLANGSRDNPKYEIYIQINADPVEVIDEIVNNKELRLVPKEVTALNTLKSEFARQHIAQTSFDNFAKSDLQAPDGGINDTNEVGGIDFRGMPIISQPAIGAVKIPVMPNLVGAVALEELDKQWMEIRTSMVQGPMPYLKIQEYIACCNARPDSFKQIQAVTNCVADILKAEEEDALPTCGQLKEILIQLG